MHGPCDAREALAGTWRAFARNERGQDATRLCQANVVGTSVLVAGAGVPGGRGLSSGVGVPSPAGGRPTPCYSKIQMLPLRTDTQSPPGRESPGSP